MSSETNKVLGKIVVKLDKDAYLRFEEVYADSGMGRRDFARMVNDAFLNRLYGILDEIDAANDVDVTPKKVV